MSLINSRRKFFQDAAILGAGLFGAGAAALRSQHRKVAAPRRTPPILIAIPHH